MSKKVFVPFLLAAVILLAACAPNPGAAANPIPNTGITPQVTPTSASVPASTPTLPPTPTATQPSAALPTQANPGSSALLPTLPPIQTPTPLSVPLTVTEVDASAKLDGYSMANYNGICQAAITFNANIMTNGAGQVTYYWLRSDGTRSQAYTLTYTGPSFQTVTDTWTANGASAKVSAWDRVYIDQPNHQFFSPAVFNLECNPPIPTKRPARPAGRVGKGSGGAAATPAPKK